MFERDKLKKIAAKKFKTSENGRRIKSLGTKLTKALNVLNWYYNTTLEKL